MKPITITFSAATLLFISGCVIDNESSPVKTKEEFSAEFEDTNHSIIKDTIANEEDYTLITKTIASQNAEFVNVDLSMDCGEFEVKGGADNLLEGQFKFKTFKSIPVINYKENEEQEGALAVYMRWAEHEDKNLNTDCKAICKLVMDNKMPMNMNIQFGAGEGNFNLQEMQIKKLKLESGAGEFNVNLMNTPIEKIEMAAGVGEANIDLSGKRTKNLKADFACGIGEITILFPSDVNINVHTSGVLGGIDAHGFSKDQRNFSYRPEKNSDIEMDINIAGGIGQINLILDK